MRRRDLATSESWAPQASEGKKNPSPEVNFISARDTPATTGSAPPGCHRTAAASANGPGGRAGAGGRTGRGDGDRPSACPRPATPRLEGGWRAGTGSLGAREMPSPHPLPHARPAQGLRPAAEALPPLSPGRRGPPRGWASRSSRRGDRPRPARRLRCPPGAGAPSEAPKGVGHSPTQADPRRRR